MPLDGSEMFDEPSLVKLRQVESMLGSEERWCKGRLHDRRGRHCLVGALSEVEGRQELTRPILRAIKEVTGQHYWRIESFNDDPYTAHRDVMRVLHRARLLIIADLASANAPRAWYRKLFDKINQVVATPGAATAYNGAAADFVPARLPRTTVADSHARQAQPARETIGAYW